MDLVADAVEQIRAGGDGGDVDAEIVKVNGGRAEAELVLVGIANGKRVMSVPKSSLKPIGNEP